MLTDILYGIVYFMLVSILPSVAGLLALAFLPKDQDGLLWTRWGCYLITILGNIASPRKSSQETPLSIHKRAPLLKCEQSCGRCYHQM